MSAVLRTLAGLAIAALLIAGGAFAQTVAIEGDVKGEDGTGLRDAVVKIERTDIKGSYKCKTNKKGHFFHAGLPLGTYRVILEVNGKDVDVVNGVRPRLGDPQVVNFDLQAMKAKRDALQRAAESGQLTKEQQREMTSEQREAFERANKERQQQMAKNKVLNEAFNTGMTALQAKDFAAAIAAFTKAGEVDPKQPVVWANLAEAYTGQAGALKGAEADAAMGKAIESYQKALELKPEDSGMHNNFGLALARAKKFDEAKAELAKAAQLDPTNAGKYYYNLGAVLTNINQLEPAGEAFKKAIESDPNYAEAQYQYGIYLTSKASLSADGKMTFAPGTKEAFEKYLQLAPNGPNAAGAKGMLDTMQSTIQTEYVNPDAKQKKATKKK